MKDEKQKRETSKGELGFFFLPLPVPLKHHIHARPAEFDVEEKYHRNN